MGEHKHHRRKVNCIGFDAYNQTETGDISKSLNASATDSDHIPCVYAVDQGAGKSGCNVTEETAPTLACTHGGEPVVFDGSRRHDYKEFGDVSETVQAQYGTGGNNTPIVVEHPTTYQETAGALCASGYDKLGVQEAMNDMYVVTEECHSLEVYHCTTEQEEAHTLKARDYKDPQVVVYKKKNNAGDYESGCGTLKACGGDYGGGSESLVTYQETAGTLTTCISKGTSNEIANNDMFVANTSIVRRLTPKECERLQAFPDDWTLLPDGWTDTKGKFHKPTDSNRYKALGNSIALCWWEWMAERMMDVFNEEIGEEATMASLFDGIGGFPLVYSRHGCKPVWASEIEEFPIAVTKARFPE
jgi:site-specific DNA-cytosine methylase